MIEVVKRNNTIQYFDPNKIINAITQAMRETIKGVDKELCASIAVKIKKDLQQTSKESVTVNDIQEQVETELMNSERKDVAKLYILYRKQRDELREIPKKNHKLLTDDFISQYKHLPNPFPTQLGQFVYYRTYSRWLPLEKRREYWWETVRRTVEFNCSLVKTTQREAELLYDNVFYLRQFLAGAGYIKDWMGPIEEERPSAYIIMLNDIEITKNYWCDPGIAAQSILLGATEKALGGCIFASVKRNELRSALKIEERYEILYVLAIGKPKEKVVLETVGTDGDIKYWRDNQGVHHVPKRTLKEIIID